MELSDFMKQLMGQNLAESVEGPAEDEVCSLDELTVEAIGRDLKDGKFKNVIVMCGAGISVAAGIPDFRSPGTGLYDNLQKYNLPEPEAVFQVDFFKENPKPFCTLAKELYPGEFNPTVAHYFIRLLHEKGVLRRCFSQNIDTLERVAGVPAEKMVEAHGSFAAASCLECGAKHTQEYVKDIIFRDEVPRCEKEECDGLVKPDIVFFGEGLPSRFFECTAEDFPECDLLIVMGTSLQVQPFAGLVRRVRKETPRLLLNMEVVGTESVGGLLAMLMGGDGGGFRFGRKNNYRDVKSIGDVQQSCVELAELAGWKADLERLVGHDLTELLEQARSRPKAEVEADEQGWASATIECQGDVGVEEVIELTGGAAEDDTEVSPSTAEVAEGVPTPAGAVEDAVVPDAGKESRGAGEERQSSAEESQGAAEESQGAAEESQGAAEESQGAGEGQVARENEEGAQDVAADSRL